MSEDMNQARTFEVLTAEPIRRNSLGGVVRHLHPARYGDLIAGALNKQLGEPRSKKSRA
ncbi:hypothetical protein [Rhizobium leucaenae]|uniref:Uncharacterized protein n=1 Tax=Rhizobium leucaenae TaxID=29450 RepID=A0A7W6ZYX4_9HYPH|nr:hypothetical protein [Rhizobium leucaenae]MBB4571204.1 hypothetical protein [Rhizobium leucaenae]MBB6304063.1 hypothetical protein [Rhizobium leucaenae]